MKWNNNTLQPEIGQEIIFIESTSNNVKYGTFYINEIEDKQYPQILHSTSTPTRWNNISLWIKHPNY